MHAFFLVIDLGTGGIHASLVGEDMRILDSGYEAVSYSKPERGPGWEFEPDALFHRTLNLAVQVLSRTISARERCLGLAVTSQRHGMVLVDGSGKELLGCPNMDNRAAETAEKVAREYGPYIYDITGRWPDYYFPAIRLAWMREKDPERFSRVERILMINEWLVWRLTGTARSEPTNAAETLLLDLPSRRWSSELQKMFQLENLRLNELIVSGAAAGGLSTAAASSLGLPEGLPVHLSHADTQAAVLGTGAAAGDVVIVNGSTTPSVRIVDSFPKDPKRRVWITPFLEGSWLIEANANISGMAYRRLIASYVELISSALKDLGLSADEQRLAEAAAKRVHWDHGGIGFWGPRVSDVKISKRSDTILVTDGSANPYEAILPSFLENLAFSVHENILLADSVAGSGDSTIFLTGGGSRNDYFTGLICSLFPERAVVRTRVLETTSIGAALSVLNAALGREGTRKIRDSLRLAVDSMKPLVPAADAKRRLEAWVRHYKEIVYPSDGRGM